MEYNKNNTNELYLALLDMATKDRSVYGMVDYLQDYKIFPDECYIGEAYDGLIFHIPLVLWNKKTGMDIVITKNVLMEYVPVLNDLMDSYQGYLYINLEYGEDTNYDYFLDIYGGS